MCRIMQVSVSGYDDWLRREPCAHEREDGELAKEIQRLFYANRSVYGSPRVHAEVRAAGIGCSRERTARLMREMELVAKRDRRTKPVGTVRHKGTVAAPNVLDRDLSAPSPQTRMGLGHDRRLDHGRLAVCGGDPGSLFPPGCGLGSGNLQ